MNLWEDVNIPELNPSGPLSMEPASSLSPMISEPVNDDRMVQMMLSTPHLLGKLLKELSLRSPGTSIDDTSLAMSQLTPPTLSFPNAHANGNYSTQPMQPSMVMHHRPVISNMMPTTSLQPNPWPQPAQNNFISFSSPNTIHEYSMNNNAYEYQQPHPHPHPLEQINVSSWQKERS
jgi:hypothetical protein